jgi:excisionase family DNA binding protein
MGISPAPTEKTWITSGEAGRRLGVSAVTVKRLARRHTLRTRQLPGGWRRFHSEDVDRIARESTSTSR